MVRNDRKRTIRLAILVGAIAALAGCINPFSSNSSGDDGGEAAAGNGGGTQFGSLVINPTGGIGASTVAPDLNNLTGLVSSYNVTLNNVSPGGVAPITVNGYTDGSLIDDIFPGTWNLFIAGLNGSGQTIATGVPTIGNPITVTSGGTANVTVELAPAQAASGELNVVMNWGSAVAPGIDVDQVSVTLYSYVSSVGETLTATGSGTQPFTDPSVTTTGTVNVDFAARTVTVSDASLTSGFYLLTMQLYEGTGIGAADYAPVIEAVQIYDYLQSAQTITLQPGELTNAPTAPTGLAATITGDNTFSLSWTDASNTEEGFNVYQGTVGGSPAATVPAGTGSASSALVNYASTAGSPITYYVTAYNKYGESAAINATFTPIGESAVGFNGGTHTNHESWAAPGDPGDLTWSPFPGAEVYVVHVNESAPAVDALSSPVSAALTGTSFDLASALPALGLGTFSPTTEYHWRVEARNAGTSGSVVSPRGSFTIRNGLLVAIGGSDGGQGSPTAPILTVTEAVNLAEPGETIRIDPGTYNEQLDITKNVLIEGTSDVSRPTIQSSGSGFNEHTIFQNAGNLTLRNLIVSAPTDPGPQYGIRVAGSSQSIELENVDIFHGPTSGAPTSVELTVDAAFTMVGGAIDMSTLGGGGPTDAAIGIRATGHTRNAGMMIQNVAFTVPSNNRERGMVWIESSPGVGALTIGGGSTFDLGIAGHAGSESFAIRSSIPATIRDSIISMGTSSASFTAIDLHHAGTIERNRIEILDAGGGGNVVDVFAAPSGGTVGVYNNIMAVRPNGGGSFGFVQTDVHTEVVHNTMVAYEAFADWIGVARTGSDFIIMRNNIVQSFSSNFGQGFHTPTGGGIEVVGNVFHRNNSFHYAGATYSNVFVFNTTTPASITQNVETAPMLSSGDNLLSNPDGWLRTLSLAGNSVVASGDSWGAASQDISGGPRVAPTTVGAYELPAGDGVAGLVGEWLSLEPNPAFDSSGVPGIAANGLALYHVPGILTTNGRYGRPGAFRNNPVQLQNAPAGPTATAYPELATAANGFTIGMWLMAPNAAALTGGPLYTKNGPDIYLNFIMNGADTFTIFLNDGVNPPPTIVTFSTGIMSVNRWYQLFLVAD
ncbi:MAG: fibronectin type III domain-containing protein, partial [Spirochaetales bacterium]|nr:fibronectin type III domain-containing protein [Spirochaetales bacterium]